MKWWGYLLIFVVLIAMYLLCVLVTYLLMKGAKKKAFQALDQMIPIEQNRFALVEEVVQAMKDDGRILPKNLLEQVESEGKDFQKTPLDLQGLKGRTDFLILYLRKYLKEKRLLSKSEKYQEYDKKLESSIYLDPQDKNSPYYHYNKVASRYNAYLGMTTLSLFGIRGKNPQAPIL